MEINIAEVIAQAIAFLIVFGVLRWKAWGPIQGALQARRDKIQGEFDKIDAAHKDIESLKSDYEARFQKIEDEARSKLTAAVDEGRKIAKDIQDKAQKDSQKNFEKSKDNLAIEVKKARIELRREIAGLVIDSTERVLKEKMTDQKQQDKVLEIIEELEKA